MKDIDALRRQTPFPDLSGAIADLEKELLLFEELVAAGSRGDLTTRKSVEKAARSITEAAASHERLATLLGAFMARLNEARQRQELFAGLLVERGNEIGARSSEMAELISGLDDLGRGATAINEALSAAASSGATETPVLTAMDQLSVQAKQIATLAHDKGFVEIERDADAIFQRLTASRRKLAAARGVLPD